jgi:hypothetical protein
VLKFPAMALSRKEQIIVERHRFDPLVIFEITAQELDQMERETLSVSEDFSFAVAGLSIAITLASVIFTVKIDSERIYETFFIVMTLGFVVAFYCGIKWFRGRKTFKGAVQKIRSRVGPLGEEGKEIDVEQLDSLPPAEASKP